MSEEPGRRERKKAQTRKSLLEVALRLFAERGIYGTRIEDITEKSDLGKGVFYNYFPSKDAMVAALVGQGVEILKSTYLARIPADASEAERLKAVIVGHEAFFDEHPAFVVLFHQARGMTKLDAAQGPLRDVFASYLQAIGDMLVRLEHQSLTASDRRVGVATVILGSIAGYRSFRIAAGIDVDSAILTDTLTAGVFAALTCPGT